MTELTNQARFSSFFYKKAPLEGRTAINVYHLMTLQLFVFIFG